MIEVAAGETRVTNVPMADPGDPQGGRFVFDNSRTLWLEVKARMPHILLNGAKVNCRKKRVAV